MIKAIGKQLLRNKFSAMKSVVDKDYILVLQLLELIYFIYLFIKTHSGQSGIQGSDKKRPIKRPSIEKGSVFYAPVSKDRGHIVFGLSVCL
jgi:hypothetical protein